MYSFGFFPGVWLKLQYADVSEHSISSIFKGCSETSAYCNFNQTPGKYPKEYKHLDSIHGESLKSRIYLNSLRNWAVIRVVKYRGWGGQSCGTYAEKIIASRDLTGNPEIYRLGGRLGNRLEDNFERDLKEKAGSLCIELICYGQTQAMGCSEYRKELSGSIKCD